MLPTATMEFTDLTFTMSTNIASMVKVENVKTAWSFFYIRAPDIACAS